MDEKFLLVITETAGLVVLDSPRARSSGAITRRTEPVGATLHCVNIIPFEGVPYGWLIPKESNKPEWVRISEKGGVIFDDDDNFKEQVDGIKAYVKVIEIQPKDGSNAIAKALNRIANALELLRF